MNLRGIDLELRFSVNSKGKSNNNWGENGLQSFDQGRETTSDVKDKTNE